MATDSCTAPQRADIERLFKKNELPTNKTALMHRIPFRAAGLPEPALDRPMTPLLSSLSIKQASALIVALKKQAGIEDDDDDD